ncbi:hypothetical protein PSD17_04130 [Pseudonocardia sp. D17]|nr:hypothetical protein PSD17_04130 [Pseudonocardia sp. D17]
MTPTISGRRYRRAVMSLVPTLIGVPAPVPERRTYEGRVVINRAELCRLVGVSTSTAERWWTRRGENGHPPVALVEGRRKFWDEAAMLEFARAQPETVTATVTDVAVFEGREVVSRRRLAQRLGISESQLALLYSQRNQSGHPEHVATIGRRKFWDEAEVVAWDAQRREAMRAQLTSVDRSGDPDELVGLDEAARVLGYPDQRTITSTRSRYPGRFPAPDDDQGRYKRRTLWAYADSRAPVGRPRGAARSSRAGDQR